MQGRPDYADVRFVAASVSVRLRHDQPTPGDALAAHRILAENTTVREAMAQFRAAREAVDLEINAAISAELDAGRITRDEKHGRPT